MGNELVSTFPLAWHIVLVIEFKDVETLRLTSSLYKNKMSERTNDMLLHLLIDGIKLKQDFVKICSQQYKTLVQYK